MTDPDLKQRAIALYDAFTHRHLDRRTFMRDLTALAGSAAAANALLAGIGASAAAAAIVAPDDTRLKAQELNWPGGAPGRTMRGYAVRLAGPIVKRPAIMVIHENRGLTDHIRDVARRLALSGYFAVAPDFLSVAGGTPTNEDEARTMIGKLDLVQTVGDAVATVNWLKRLNQSTGRVGAVGFCWGGAMVNRVAVSAENKLRAGVAYYGPAPDPARAASVKAALMLHYAGIDDRVNASAPAWIAALQAAKVSVEAHTYAGVNHAFNNDTSAARYDKAAADLAWSRTLTFFKTKLGD